MSVKTAESSDIQELLKGNWPVASFIPHRYKPGNLGNWSGHLPFANDLIAALRPEVFVELGTHFGESYFGFCQAVAENASGTTCFAVDHWRGEEHSGQYGEEVFEDVWAYNEALYKPFSHLLRTSFDEAASQFNDNSISLLHIDGLHTFEAGLHDFNTWFPKVAPGGVVLLHDIAARHADFGIWRLWEAMEHRYETFAFHHSWGLGVIRKPGPELEEGSLLARLFRSSPDQAEWIRRYYVLCATYLEHTLNPAPVSPPERTTDIVQIFPFMENGYSEETAVKQVIGLKDYRVVSAPFPNGLGNGPLRLDPCEHDGVIHLRRFTISSAVTGESLWDSQDPAVLESFPVSGLIYPIQGIAPACFLSYGPDPQIYFHGIPDVARHESVTVTIELAVGHDLRDLAQMFQESTRFVSAYGGLKQISDLRDQLAKASTGYQGAFDRATAAEAEVSDLRQQVESCQGRELILQTQLSDLSAKHAGTLAQVSVYENELRSLRAAQKEVGDLQEQLARASNVLDQERRHSKQLYAEAVGTFEKEREIWQVRMAQLADTEAQLAVAQDQLSRASADRSTALDRIASLEAGLDNLRRDLSASISEADALRRAVVSEQSRRLAIEHSLSWALTGPLRRWGGFLIARRSR